MGGESSLVSGWALIGVTLSVGLLLLIFRPYSAFLFAVFVLLASSGSLRLTKTEELGAYFQLGDACLLVMIMVFLWEKRRALIFPAPAMLLIAVLIMGFFNSLINQGFNYGVLRSLRWAITLPLIFFLTANVVQEERKIRWLLITLVLAAITAEIQHFFFIFQNINLMGDDPGQVRTLQFGGGSEMWLLTGFYLVGGSIPHPWVQTAIGTLFLAGNVANQTRSVALSLMGALAIYYFWFLKGPYAFRWQRIKGLLPIFVIGFILMVMVGLSALITGYGERFVKTAETGQDTESRWNVLRVEFNDWLDGNPIIGRGLNYYESRKSGDWLIRKSGIAYGHLGYVTYLSQLGLIGFVVYGFWFPFVVVLRARRLFQRPGDSPEIVHLAALTGTCIIYYALVSLMSGSLLNISIFPGILAGSVWGISTFQDAENQIPFKDYLNEHESLVA